MVPIPSDFHWNKAAEVLLGHENAWPLPTVEWHQIEFMLSIAILLLFIYHNIKPTTHRTIFNEPVAGFIYHLVQGQKIDLATFIYEQIHALGI